MIAIFVIKCRTIFYCFLMQYASIFSTIRQSKRLLPLQPTPKKFTFFYITPHNINFLNFLPPHSLAGMSSSFQLESKSVTTNNNPSATKRMAS